MLILVYVARMVILAFQLVLGLPHPVVLAPLRPSVAVKRPVGVEIRGRGRFRVVAVAPHQIAALPAALGRAAKFISFTQLREFDRWI
jgi:hypothetical protein